MGNRRQIWNIFYVCNRIDHDSYHKDSSIQSSNTWKKIKLFHCRLILSILLNILHSDNKICVLLVHFFTCYSMCFIDFKCMCLPVCDIQIVKQKEKHSKKHTRITLNFYIKGVTFQVPGD